MLTGIDISSYQSDMDIRRITGVDFVVIKATEGTGYVNPNADTHYQEAKAKGILRGVYHFAADKANSAKDEAAFFVNNIRGYLGDALLALDNENSTYNSQGNVAWCLEWLQEVERLTDIKPLIYMNASCVNSFDWSPVINNGNALWVAAYQASAPDVNWPNNNQAAWQFTSSAHVTGYSGSLDEDKFWGDANGWHAYAAQVSSPSAPAPVQETPQPEPSTSTTPVSSPAPVAVPEPVSDPAPVPPVVETTSPDSTITTSPEQPIIKSEDNMNKLKSRKFWMTAAGIVVAVISALEGAVSGGTALLSVTTLVAVYNAIEGAIDHKSVQ